MEGIGPVALDELDAQTLACVRGVFPSRRAALDALRGLSSAPGPGRLVAALARLPSLAWPWAGPIGLVERTSEDEAGEVHVAYRWCYLGSARSDAELAELLENDPGRRAFDYAHYRILARQIAARRLRIVPLSRPARLEAQAELQF